MARKITTVVFDKTGTLTNGEFGVSSMNVLDDGLDEQRVIQLAASLEQQSEHPIASGILAKANELGVDLLEVDDFEVLQGKGIQGQVDQEAVKWYLWNGEFKERFIEENAMKVELVRWIRKI